MTKLEKDIARFEKWQKEYKEEIMLAKEIEKILMSWKKGYDWIAYPYDVLKSVQGGTSIKADVIRRDLKPLSTTIADRLTLDEGKILNMIIDISYCGQNMKPEEAPDYVKAHHKQLAQALKEKSKEIITLK